MKVDAAKILFLGFLAITSVMQVRCGTQPTGEKPVDWSSFVAISGPGLKDSNLDELSRTAGFRVVLPSYLPPGMSRSYLLSSQSEPQPNGAAYVSLLPEADSSPGIQIDEQIRPAWMPVVPNYTAEYQTYAIDSTVVGCLTETLNVQPQTPVPEEDASIVWRCTWPTQQLYFNVAFSWQTDAVGGGIKREHRDEALKVIKSMIEDPYLP